ncbi:MAG: aminopeptidase [Clostridiales bacterium]|nr:aminopeptidase [Clostridiales bacterium]
MKKKVLKEYAKLIAQKGVNIQKGQEVWITASLDQPEFVEMLVGECYALGAKEVVVDWQHNPLVVLNSKYMSQSTMNEFKDWQIERMKYQSEILPARIYLDSDDPDGLKNARQDKIAKEKMAKYPIRKPYIDAMDNKYQWCICAVPSVAWAKKVFPNERASIAVEKLWEAILYTSRAESTPIENWNRHNADVHAKCDYLNSLNLKYLEYSASNGTNLKVELLENADFLAGSEKTLQGVEFNPNIPSEEVFTTPKAGSVEGIVYATKPRSYQGALIENFWIKFEDGKVSEVHAEKNEDLLKQMVAMDEGAKMLGECALVPYDSPISNSGILFYNTLFDENASCHLALGRGFSNCIKNFEKYTQEDFDKMGVNTSMIHVDFMIGSSDMNIVGITKEGKKIQIFKDGNWAF